jgi:ribosomal protein L37AE/L43A
MIKAKPKVQLGTKRGAPSVAEIDALMTAPMLDLVEAPTTESIMTTAQREADELFAEVEPPPLKSCPVCGSTRGKRAHRNHDVCRACTDAPDAVATRLAIAIGTVLRDQHSAAQRAQGAYLALSDEERSRYDAYMSLRSRDEVGDVLTEQERRRLNATNAAYSNSADTRISDALRRCRNEDECLFWANAALAGRLKERDVKFALLGNTLEDLGRKADADKLYQETR